MKLPVHISEILGKTCAEIAPGSTANCFWATKYFFYKNAFPPTHLDGIEILRFVADHFQQVKDPKSGDVFVIWSHDRTDNIIDSVDVEYLATYPKGFPFGLVVEHSGVILDEDMVFQKASPKAEDIFEVVDAKTAFQPYEKMLGYRQTFHRQR